MSFSVICGLVVSPEGSDSLAKSLGRQKADVLVSEPRISVLDAIAEQPSYDPALSCMTHKDVEPGKWYP